MMIDSQLIDKLCLGSNRQIDESLKPRLQALKNRDDDKVKDELQNICGDIINFSLASGFVLRILQLIYQQLGGSLEEVTGKIHVTKLTESKNE